MKKGVFNFFICTFCTFAKLYFKCWIDAEFKLQYSNSTRDGLLFKTLFLTFYYWWKKTVFFVEIWKKNYYLLCFVLHSKLSYFNVIDLFFYNQNCLKNLSSVQFDTKRSLTSYATRMGGPHHNIRYAPLSPPSSLDSSIIMIVDHLFIQFCQLRNEYQNVSLALRASFSKF